MIALFGGVCFLLGVAVGWGLSRSVLPACLSKGVVAMRHHMWEWISRHTVGIVVVTVLILTAIGVAEGYLYAHKDDFQHCVNRYIAQVSKAQAPRAKATVDLQIAQARLNAKPDSANRIAYELAYQHYKVTVEKYAIPPAPPCLGGARK